METKLHTIMSQYKMNNSYDMIVVETPFKLKLHIELSKIFLKKIYLKKGFNFKYIL